MNITRKLLMFVAIAGSLVFAQQANQQPAAAQQPKAEKAAVQQTNDKNAQKAEAAAPAKAEAKPQAKPEAKPAPADTTKKAEPAKAEAKPQAKPEAKPAPADTSKKAATDFKAVPADTTKKAEPAKAEAKPAPVATKADSAATDTTKKKPRGKITYQDYQAKVRHEADSILSINYHHGVTVAPGRFHDKSYGDIVRNADWGCGLGIYYFYRYYFRTIAFQGRAGILYRYANFKDDKDVTHGELSSGNEYDLNQHLQLTYKNFSFDMPLTVKFGGHVEPTTFLYLSMTFGVTKSLYEKMYSEYTLSIKDPSKELEEEIAILEKEGKATYPLTETHEIEKPFYMDDWETNGWVGFGIDGKYMSLGFDFLVAAGSTKDNHRYYRIFQKGAPSFRAMIDFSMR